MLMPTIVYLGGMSRSGSTLAERLLGELPGVCPAGEVVHLWRRGILLDEHCGCGERFSGCPFWRKVGEAGFGGWDRVDVGRFEELQRRVDRTRFIPLLAAPPMMPAGFRRALEEYLTYYQRLYAAISDVTGCGTVVDSSKHASLAFCLAGSSLDVRFVHLVRDPRGVAYSWTRLVNRDVVAGTYMRTQRAARTALQWDSQNIGMELLAPTRAAMLQVRYEDLVTAPQAVLREITAFAGLPTAGALDFLGGDSRSRWADLGVAHAVSGNRMRFATGRVEIRTDDTWRLALPPRARVRVSTLTIPWRARYGYLRAAPTPDRPTTAMTRLPANGSPWTRMKGQAPLEDGPCSAIR
jgi:Sulfotransferase family